MEAPFDVAIDIDVEYEVGSPPSTGFDPYLIASPGIVHHESSWQSQAGPDEGIVTSNTTKVYPNFTDTARRQVFMVAMAYEPVGGVPPTRLTVQWNGVLFPVTRLWLNTDPSWPTAGPALADAAEGAWFACEGELEDDFRKMRPGTSGSFSL